MNIAVLLLGIVIGSLATTFVSNYKTIRTVKGTVSKIQQKLKINQGEVVDMTPSVDLGNTDEK